MYTYFLYKDILVPWHLVANGAFFVELCRGCGGRCQRRRRRIWFICGSAALGFEHSGAYPLPCVVHAPNAHAAIVAGGD